MSTEGRIVATTATQEEVDAMKRFMEVYASSLGDGQTKALVYNGGTVTVSRQDGAFHAAINVPINTSGQ